MNNETLARVFRFWETHYRQSADATTDPKMKGYFSGKADTCHEIAQALECPQRADELLFSARCFGFETEGNQ